MSTPRLALIGLLLLPLPVLPATASRTTSNNLVRIDSGPIHGATSGSIRSFKGIPYAAPPLGNLRWRAPQPVASWHEVRPAVDYGPDCMQKPIPGDAAASGGVFSEDCLFVNVWRPASRARGNALPVLVWIHGGGFLNGGSSTPLNDGSSLARQGLVVVSFNYRLGRLGFFMHPALSAENPDASGNFGFLDQLAALQWVRRNIKVFGGDPGRVTIMGESAGGISVMHLLTWPAARGLFHRAVVMSGGGRTYLIADTGAAPVARAQRAGMAFAESMGIDAAKGNVLAALRALPVEKVNGDMSMEALLTKPATYAGGPILDGRVVTRMPADALRDGSFTKVPVLIGTTSDDLPVLFPPREDPLSVFGAEAPAARAIYSAGAENPVTMIKDIAVDRTMHEPARFVAKRVATSGLSAWIYRFGYTADSLGTKPAGAEHSTELPYLFGTEIARYGAAATEKDRAAGRAFQDFIAAFAKHGDPNHAGATRWPRFDAAEPGLMMFKADATAVFEPDPWQLRLDLVEHASDTEAGKSTS